MTPAERTMRARLAAHVSWSNTTDRTDRTAPGRRSFDDRFADQVDPERKLPPEERRQRAESARKAYFTALALRSAQVRRARASRRRPGQSG